MKFKKLFGCNLVIWNRNISFNEGTQSKYLPEIVKMSNTFIFLLPFFICKFYNKTLGFKISNNKFQWLRSSHFWKIKN